MVMKKTSGDDGMRVYVGVLADNTDEFNMRYSLEISGRERVDTCCRIAEDYFRRKGVDLNARRLDRTVRVVRKAWR